MPRISEMGEAIDKQHPYILLITLNSAFSVHVKFPPVDLA